MKKKILLSFMIVFLITIGMGSTFAAKTKYFGNLTEAINDESFCFVKYGKSISILDPTYKITINDSRKARLNANGNRMEIIGTGKFTVTVQDGKKTKDITFFAWNAQLKSGQEQIYSNMARTQKHSNISGKVYLAVSTTSYNGTLQINEFKTVNGNVGNIKGKYIRSYYNNSKVTNWIYGFDTEFVKMPNLKDIEFELYFLPVGKADAIVIISKGKVALIDGGHGKATAEAHETVATDVIVDFLWRDKGIKTINYLIGTHTHPDHVGCWPEISKKFNFEKIYVSEYAKLSGTYDERIGKVFTCEIIQVGAGDIIQIGNAKMKVLSPNKNLGITKKEFNKDKEEGLINALSLVTKVEYNKYSFLLTADAFQESDSKYAKDFEKQLLATYGKELAVDVLKLPHHGFNKISNEVLNKILPKDKKQWIVITCYASDAEKMKKKSNYNTRHDWIIKRLNNGQITSNTTFVYPATRENYVLFKIQGNNFTREYN